MKKKDSAMSLASELGWLSVDSHDTSKDSAEVCAVTASKWIWQVWLRAKNDPDAQRFLRNLAVEAVELARSRSVNNQDFQDASRPLIDGAFGKEPETRSPQRDQWIQAGWFHGVLKDGGDPTVPSKIPAPTPLAKLALEVFEDRFGADWQDAQEIAEEFSGTDGTQKYGTDKGPEEWRKMARYQKRNAVFQALKKTAETWIRQKSKVRSKKR